MPKWCGCLFFFVSTLNLALNSSALEVLLIQQNSSQIGAFTQVYFCKGDFPFFRNSLVS
jgi:hypothetical protein